MPPHIIIMGMPPCIMAIMRLQHSMNIAGSMPSIGFISQTMPASVILHDIMPIILGIIIGLPLNMDGSEGTRAQASCAFVRNLEPLGLPILLWDERWSTASAERGLIEQDMSRAKRAERIDSAAAAVILQAAIDALAGSAF